MGILDVLLHPPRNIPLCYPDISLRLYLQLYWLATVGTKSWVPAWPANRTRLVFLMVSIPTWGLVMLICTVGFTVLKSVWASRGEFYEAIELDPEPCTNFRRGYVQCRWHLSALLYLSLFICGLFMLSTRELPGDVRFKAEIQAAIKSPRPEGQEVRRRPLRLATPNPSCRESLYWCHVL